MQTILVTGAAGFIGTNFVRMLLARSEDVKLIAYDKLTYAGNLANLSDLLQTHRERLVFVKGDVCDAAALARTWEAHGISHVVHFAAESHVDRSIMDSGPFVQTNVLGTQVLLDAARHRGVQRFVLVSTDEVYGSLPEDDPSAKFTEETPLAPNSPYSASKAGGDLLGRAAFHTFGLPVMITRCSNNYGPYQFPEKIIPLAVTNLMEGKKIPLYGDGMNVRDWLFAEDHCEAIWAVLQRGKPGEVYNIGGDNELPNRKLIETILAVTGKRWDECVEYVKDRAGHDRRYAIDATKIKTELNWTPRRKFEEAIQQTIRWYHDNRPWWTSIKSGEYRRYYEKQYGEK